MRAWLRRTFRDDYVVRRALWPYHDGWAVYQRWERVVVDPRFSTRWAAQERCNELNHVEGGDDDDNDDEAEEGGG